MRQSTRVKRLLAGYLILSQLFASIPARAEHPIAQAYRFVQLATYQGKEPQLGGDNCVEELAQNIDWLEHHIDTYGSIVAKSPDIWGQARLTKQRDEYERIMYRELTNFNVKINAAISQSDSSFLSQAFALSEAVSGATKASSSSVTAITSAPNTPDTQAATAAAFPQIKSIDSFTAYNSGGIALEPTIELDQLSRYLNHLHELRRINEGDDTSDSPGYSLNLVRIPVSILPGKLTQTGFGAEITVTATPVISDDLMPNTFHNLAVNDMVDLLGLPLVRVTEALGPLKADVARDLLTTTQSKIEQAYRESASAGPDAMVDMLATTVVKAWRDEYVRDAIVKAAATGDPTKKAAGAAVTTGGSLFEPGMSAHESARSEQAALDLEPEFAAKQLQILIPDKAREQQAYDLRALDQVHSGNATERATGIKTLKKDVPQLKLDDLLKPKSEQAWRDAYELNRKAISEKAEASAPPMAPQVKANLALLKRAAQRNDAKLAVTAIVNLHFLAPSDKGIEQCSNVLDNAIAILVKNGGSAGKAAATIIPSGRARRALEPLSPTQVADVMGVQNLMLTASFFNNAYYGRAIRWNGVGSNCTPPKKDGDKSQTKDGDKPQALETRVDLLDAQKFLQEELESAHSLLSQPEQVHLYASLAAPCSGLAEQINGGHITEGSQKRPSVEEIRHNFFRQLHANMIKDALQKPPCSNMTCMQTTDPSCDIDDAENSEAANTVEFLAWSLIVESALLNDRLNLDVRKIAKAKEVSDLETPRDYWFFLPEIVTSPKPGMEDLAAEFQQASPVFKRYVEVRWPIHVFAVDPREQDQNVADASARRREMQFALSLGFVNGQIGANSLTRYSRTLETEIETISLNQTVVGFGHGDDTFGWRFQPRVQALPIPGTLGTIRETICGASRDYDLRHRQLEPGQRECVAIVLMPSFVPYADFDVRSNWYALTNPKNSAITMKDAVHLSRAITAMRNSQQCCANCACLYRDNEVGRLFKRVDQLDRELPLQTMRTLVPYENTLGGFEMFNTGVTDLGPQLVGWYGAPGIKVGTGDATNSFNCANTAAPANGFRSPIAGPLTYKDSTSGKDVVVTTKDATGSTVPVIVPNELPVCEGQGTTVFLVGKNFSVHDTKIIAGGVCIPSVQLVSRSIMRVTIPSCVQTVSLCENNQNNEYVAVYLATPYGVTNHLHIPVQRDMSKPVQDQIKQAVSDDLKAMSISGPPISIAAIDPNNKTVYVDVACSGTAMNLNCTDLTGSVKLNPQLQYITKNDPRLQGRKLLLKVAPLFKEGFRSGLTDVEYFPTMPAAESFDSAGKTTSIISTTPPHTKSPQAELLDSITKNLKLSDFSGGKVTLKLVYFAQIDNDVPIQLMDQFDLLVTLTSAPVNANGADNSLICLPMCPQSASASPAPGNASLPNGGSSPPAATSAAPAPTATIQSPEPLPAPSGAPALQPAAQPSGSATPTNGCGCSQVDCPSGVALTSGTRPAGSIRNAFQSVSEPREPRELPATASQRNPELRLVPQTSPAGSTSPAASGSQHPQSGDQTASPVSANSADSPNRLAVQLAQCIMPIQAQPATTPAAQPAASSSSQTTNTAGQDTATQLADINTKLQALAQQETALQAALAKQTTPATGAAGQSVINVNIQPPQKHCTLQDKFHFPLVHQTLVKAGECWRDTRDLLPCY